jgi:hypothetical protein
MLSLAVPQGRRSTRVVSRKRASLVTTLDGVPKIHPCLIVDRSQEGFRLRSGFKLRRGQLVELILDDPVDSVRCEVVWVGKAGSRQEGEAGLQIVSR